MSIEPMRYAVTCVFLGSLLIGGGMVYGGYAWLAAWFGLSFLLTGLGHAGLGPRIYAKSYRGRLPLWTKALHLPFFAYTWAVWHIIRLVSVEEPYVAVNEFLFIGRRVLPNERPRDIDHWVDLTAEFDEPAVIRQHAGYICLPILDGGVPPADALEDALSKVSDGFTYVHCAQGHGRTGLFALCLLLRNAVVKGVDEGIELLGRVRPGMTLNRKQEQFVRQFAREHGCNARTAASSTGRPSP